MGSVALGSLPALGAPPPEVPKKQAKQLERLVGDAERLGPWDGQYQLIEQATDNIFRQQGWDSEADLYARKLMRDVGRISPWQPQQRMKAFMDALQVRYGLTHDQRTSLYNDVQRESLVVGMKHLKTTLPIAMEAIRTRAKQEPFTAQQVQRWSRALKPLMNDSRQVVEQICEKLKKTMTPEQRKKLELDLEGFRKRHRDVEKLMKKWQAGHWTPADWGLQNDPMHAGAMADHLASEEERDRRVEAAQSKEGLDEAAIATDESAWDKYVRHFCDRYACTDTQRTQANSILKIAKQEAFTIRYAREDLIEKHRRLSRTAKTAEERQKHAAEYERLLSPIGAIFNRMKGKLPQVLTTEQRRQFAARQPVKAGG